MTFRPGTKSATVAEILTEHPDMPQPEIAALAGCTAPLVSKVSTAMGILDTRTALARKLGFKTRTNLNTAILKAVWGDPHSETLIANILDYEGPAS